MASATVSPRNSDDLSLKWSGRWSLTTRILAVNIFAVAMLAGSVYYLDIFRERMTDERLGQIAVSAQFAAAALTAAPPERRLMLAAQLGRANQSRIDRKSTRLNSITNAHLVCRLLLEKKTHKTH